jgi:hypothetical protein
MRQTVRIRVSVELDVIVDPDTTMVEDSDYLDAAIERLNTEGLACGIGSSTPRFLELIYIDDY